MSKGSAMQQVAQNKATAYGCELALCLWGVTLTQWSTIIGIVVAIFGSVLAFLTYRSNKWKNERMVREMKDHHEAMKDIARRSHGQDLTD